VRLGRKEIGLRESADAMQIVSGLSITLIAWFFGDLSWGVSAFLGACAAIAYQLYLGRIMDRVAKLPGMEGVALIQRASMLRWIFVFLMVALAIRSDFFHIWWMLGTFFWGQAFFYLSLALRDLDCW